MILYPSIHLKDKVVARLTRSGGDWRDVEVLHNNPVERAKQFEAQKFPWLHVVDLDGAFGGVETNVGVIEGIIKALKIPVQLSGGIRDVKAIGKWLERGASRIVLTTVAVEHPDIVREACRLFPGQIAVKIDSRGGFVTSTGWTQTSSTRALDLALRVEEMGVAAIIHADINPDGALSEVNFEAIIDLAFALTVPVIASGGVQSLQEIMQLKQHENSGIAGLILGRALYNGKIKAHEALEIANQELA